MFEPRTAHSLKAPLGRFFVRLADIEEGQNSTWPLYLAPRTRKPPEGGFSDPARKGVTYPPLTCCPRHGLPNPLLPLLAIEGWV